MNPFVSYPPNRVNIIPAADSRKFGAYFADMLFDHVCIAFRIIAPDQLINSFLIEDLPCVGEQKFDQVKFCFGKRISLSRKNTCRLDRLTTRSPEVRMGELWACLCSRRRWAATRAVSSFRLKGLVI